MKTQLHSTHRRIVVAVMLVGLACPLTIRQVSADPIVFGMWKELGPQLFRGINPLTGQADEAMSGQPSAIAVDLVNDPTGNTVYVASSGGGLWKSTDGLSVSPHFDLISNPNFASSCGAVALDSRTNPPTIYVGTGDPDNPSNVNSYAGTGILISRDGGQTWSEVESADGGAHPFKGMGFSRIIVDPENPDVLLASTGVGSDGNFAHSVYPQGLTSFQHLGIYRSTDAGNTWTRVMESTPQGNNIGGLFHIEIAHESSRDLYIAGVSKQGLFVSADDGTSWESFADYGLPTAGLPNPADMQRISLATRDGTIWALVLTPPMIRLFELVPDAVSWREIPKPAGLEPKGFLGYVAAPPGSNGLVVATQFLFRTDDVTVTSPTWFDIEGSLHGDQHAIAFVNADIWYVGDDGGAFATLDRGNTPMWRSLNAGLRTMEYYSASADSADAGSYAGGQQDNGPSLSTDGATWDQVLLGDGVYADADPQDPGAFFISTQFGHIAYVSTTLPFMPQRVVAFFVPPPDPPDPNVSGGRGAFLTPYEILPNDTRLYDGVAPPAGFDFNQARILLTGNTNPWMVGFVPGAPNPVFATQLTTEIDTAYIQYVAPDPQDPTTAYVVTGDVRPALYRLTNMSFAGGASVEKKEAPAGPLNIVDVLGHVAVSPFCSEAVYLAKVGFREGQKLFKTTTGGDRWTNISGNLPNVPVHWITLDPTNPDVLYIGTHVGVFVATDGGVEGEEWQPLGTNLPHVPVMQLKISSAGELIAATFGRGIWTLSLPDLPAPTPKPPVITDVSVGPDLLWPPNHKMVDVTVDYDATDDCGTPACTLSVVSSEPSDSLGDGATQSDIEIIDHHHLRLRAERSGPNAGRTYAVSVTCVDGEENASSITKTVLVPHDRRGLP